MTHGAYIRDYFPSCAAKSDLGDFMVLVFSLSVFPLLPFFPLRQVF